MGFLKSIIARVGMDGSDFEIGAKKIEDRAHHMGAEVSSAFKEHLGEIFGAAAMEELFRREVEFGEKMVDLSHRLGIGTDAVQVWDYALKKNGATIDSAVGFFEKLGVARAKALGGGTGGDQLVKNFKDLGVAVEDLKSKRIEDIAEQISETFTGGGDPQQLIEALKGVGGKGAGEMIATLRDGLKETREEAERLGIVVQNDVLQQLKETGDRMHMMGAQLQAGFAPVVAWITMAFGRVQHAISGAMFGTIAAVSSLWNNLKNAGHTGISGKEAIKDAMHAFYEQEQQESEAMDAEDKALADKAERDKKAKPTNFDEDEVKSKREVNEELKKRLELEELIHKHALNSLSVEDRKKQLQNEINTLALVALGLNLAGDHKGATEVNTKAAQEQLELDELNKPKHGHRPHADSLARIGGSIGGAAENVMVNLAREQLAAMKQVAANTAPKAPQTPTTTKGDTHQ